MDGLLVDEWRFIGGRIGFADQLVGGLEVLDIVEIAHILEVLIAVAHD